MDDPSQCFYAAYTVITSIDYMIDDYVLSRPQAVAYTSLGQLKYLSALKYVSGVIGNSSSGIIEAPSLKTGTINIGDRQKGRVRAKSVIDCGSNLEDISIALQTLFSEGFQKQLDSCINPHGSGNVSSRITDILREASLKDLSKKRFHDLKYSEISG